MQESELITMNEAPTIHNKTDPVEYTEEHEPIVKLRHAYLVK